MVLPTRQNHSLNPKTKLTMKNYYIFLLCCSKTTIQKYNLMQAINMTNVMLI